MGMGRYDPMSQRRLGQSASGGESTQKIHKRLSETFDMNDAYERWRKLMRKVYRS